MISANIGRPKLGFLIPSVPEILPVLKDRQSDLTGQRNCSIGAAIVYQNDLINDIEREFAVGPVQSQGGIVCGHYYNDFLFVQHRYCPPQDRRALRKWASLTGVPHAKGACHDSSLSYKDARMTGHINPECSAYSPYTHDEQERAWLDGLA
jgi:hypothetical protein